MDFFSYGKMLAHVSVCFFCRATGLCLSWAFLLMVEYSYFKVTSVNWVSRFLSESFPG